MKRFIQTPNQLNSHIANFSICVLLTDCGHLHWIYTRGGEYYQKDKGQPLAGQGILITHGLFAVLNYYSKINYLLDKNYKYLITEEDIETRKKLLSELKVNNEDLFELIDKQFQPRRNREINELEAFVKLINDSQIDLGVIGDDLEEVWRIFRNGIAHTGYPNQGKYQVILRNGVPDEKVFTITDDLLKTGKRIKLGLFLLCNNDLLFQKTNELANFLGTKIQKRNRTDQGIIRVHDYIWQDCGEFVKTSAILNVAHELKLKYDPLRFHTDKKNLIKELEDQLSIETT